MKVTKNSLLIIAILFISPGTYSFGTTKTFYPASSGTDKKSDPIENQNKRESPDLVRINISNGVAMDQTVVYFVSGGTDGFDSDYDAHKMPGNGLHISSYAASGNGKDDMAINGISDVKDFNIPFKITSLNQDNCVVTIEQYINVKGRILYIYNKATNKYHLITEGGSYNLGSIITISLGQFFITNFNPNIVTGIIEAVPNLSGILITPNPYYSGPLIIQIPGAGSETSTIEISDAEGKIVKTVFNNGNTSGGILEINIENEVRMLHSGTYIVNYKGRKAGSQQKIVILK